MRCAALLSLSGFFVLAILSLHPAANAVPILPRDSLSVRCPSYECRNTEIVTTTSTSTDDMQSKVESFVDAIVLLLSGFKASLAESSSDAPSTVSSEPSASIDVSTVIFTPNSVVAASTSALTPSATST